MIMAAPTGDVIAYPLPAGRRLASVEGITVFFGLSRSPALEDVAAIRGEHD